MSTVTSSTIITKDYKILPSISLTRNPPTLPEGRHPHLGKGKEILDEQVLSFESYFKEESSFVS